MIPFYKPFIDKETEIAVLSALRTGWLSSGPLVSEFEKKLTTYTKASAVVCTGSAGMALQMVLKYFEIGKGDEVILPAFTHPATANAVVLSGAQPVFADISYFSMTLCAEDTSRKITKRTKAIIPVDIAGMPCDYDGLKNVIQSAASDFEPNSIMQEKLGRILLLSDASHSFGASVDGKKSGTLADVTVFSFHAVKNLTTGEGGAVCINLPDSFDVEHSVNFFKAARVHGLTADALSKLKNKSWEYDVLFPSGKSVMSDITAAIGLNHLNRYENVILKKRYELYDMYNAQLSEHESVETPLIHDDNKMSSCHLYIIKQKNVSFSEKNQIMRKMYDAGIITNLQFIPIPLLSWYKNNGFTTNGLTVTMKVYDECMSLPLFHDLTKEQISFVCDYLKKIS